MFPPTQQMEVGSCTDYRIVSLLFGTLRAYLYRSSLGEIRGGL